MGGKKVRNIMKLKPYIENELRKSERELKPFFTPENDYTQGKIDALKWVLGKE